ncbi:MAG: pilus assembly protein [Anaerolineae bacterium]|nr:pilus assembly protein [Anaerolineae bacterium]
MMRKFLKKLVQILDGTPAGYGQQRQRGQSLVELAFITPILIIMVAGIAEIGWYANNYINLLEAAKVGARRGPFLNGENAPQLFPMEASIAPMGDSSGFGFLEPPEDGAFDPNDPRNRTRGLTNPRSLRCDGIDVNDFGFYNIIACTVLDSLDPLEIRTGENPDTEAPYKDDIVISVFATQAINNCERGTENPEDPKPETNDCDMEIGAPYLPGHQVVVVGRYPANANECAAGGANQEGRDPFDYIINNTVDSEVFTTPSGKDVWIPFELSIPTYNAAGTLIKFKPLFDPVVAEGETWTDETQRGWSWTGQYKVGAVDGFTSDCWGSEFTLDEVQALLNLPNFVRPGDGDYQDRRSYLPSQGLVLVEIFWEHELLMGGAFPIFYGAYSLFTNLSAESGGNIIRVWAAFPAAAAEPHLTFGLD